MRKFIFILLTIILLPACRQEKPQCVDPWATTGVNEDSFRQAHYYWKNFNFVTTDSVALESHIPGEVASIYTRDSAMLGNNDEIVVANVAIVPTDSLDSVWVMVARDQITMGWLREKELLEKAIPDNTISVIVHEFSDSRVSILMACIGAAIIFSLVQNFRRRRFLIVHFNDIRSFYPTLLCLTVSMSASLYGAMVGYWPEVWRSFLFHPTVDPFGQPPILMSFLANVWFMLIVFVAVIDDLRKQPDVSDAASYLSTLCGVCMILYFVFTHISVHPLGFVVLLAYWCYALRQHWVNNHASYRCGVCGSAMRQPGKCSHCGAVNED